jgi:hypothetical protein
MLDQYRFYAYADRAPKGIRVDVKVHSAGGGTWFVAAHIALIVSIAALLVSGIALYYQRRGTRASETSAMAAEASATSSGMSAKAAADSAKSAKDLLDIEQAREYDRTRPKLSGRLVLDSGAISGPTNAWLEIHLDASTPQPLRKVLLTVPIGAWFGRGGVSSWPTLMSSDLGFPGGPGQVAPLRAGRPARWRVRRADDAHGTVVATATCTREDGAVWEDVEVTISQDYGDSRR